MAWQSNSLYAYYTWSFTLKDVNINSSITFCFSLRKASLMQLWCLCLRGFWGATGWIWSPVFESRQSACTQESGVTFVSELFQLKLLCSSPQLFLISHSILLLSCSQHLRMDNPQPPSITTTILHTDTHSQLLSHVKIETRTTTGVYTRSSVHIGFRVIYEVGKEIKHDRLHCV